MSGFVGNCPLTTLSVSLPRLDPGITGDGGTG